MSYDDNSSCPKGENMGCPPRRYNQRRSDGACSSGKDLIQVSASPTSDMFCSRAFQLTEDSVKAGISKGTVNGSKI